MTDTRGGQVRLPPLISFLLNPWIVIEHETSEPKALKKLFLLRAIHKYSIVTSAII